MGLPAPINGTEQYLAAVYDRLGDILDRLPDPAAASAGQQDPAEPKELREPAPPPTPAKRAPVEVTEPKRPAAGSAEAAPPAAPAALRPARTARRPAARKGAANKTGRNHSRKEK